MHRPDGQASGTSRSAALILAALVLDAVLLAVVELLYLPLYLGSIQFPVTVLLAIVATRWLVKVAAAECGGLLPATAPLAAWVLAVLVLGSAGPGGDVLLPVDWRSFALLAGGMFPAAVTLGRQLPPATLEPGRDRVREVSNG